MFFSKKKKETNNTLKVMYYEGLQGFMQDYPCTITLEDDFLIIKKVNPDLTVKLPINQITAIDALPEKNFMVQYHNNPGTTARVGKKFYYVFKYTSSAGESKHVAFWDVTSNSMNQVLYLREKLSQQSTPSDYVL